MATSPADLETDYNEPQAAQYLGLVVRREHVKAVKRALEERGALNGLVRIQGLPDASSVDSEMKGLFLVPTLIATPQDSFDQDDHLSNSDDRDDILVESMLEDLAGKIVSKSSIDYQGTGLLKEKRTHTPAAAAKRWLEELPLLFLNSLRLSLDTLEKSFPTTYTLYTPMLLLPANTFQHDSWTTLLSALSQSQLQHFYACIARSVSATRLAINAAIPLCHQNPTTTDPGQLQQNILRRPTNLTPLYGDFGPPTSTANPTTEDFTRAFWVQTRQNGITQTWAPLYTMFSRGNITEKARLLRLPSVTEAVEVGRRDGMGCAAVDLYAGIGYFAFSYVKAGVGVVLCWEMNPWSVEGLKRGAGSNGWDVQFHQDQEGRQAGKVARELLAGGGPRILAFQESNEHAPGKIRRVRKDLPPIRHVNCGLLPTSRGSWETAVAAIDPELGGWVHLHENLAVKDIEEASGRILAEVQMIFERLVNAGGSSIEEQSLEGHGRREIVVLKHVERVKTYAPGVMHCVLDIYVPPRKSRI